MTEPFAPAAEIREALEFHRRGDLERARQSYQEYLDGRPDDVQALGLLAALEGQEGNHATAEATYRRAISADGEYGPAWAGLGASLLLQGRPEDAVEPLTRAVRAMPDEAEIRLQLTLALQRCNRLREARQILEELVERWPSHISGRHNLGLLLLQTGEPDAAAEQFRLALTGDPDHYRSRVALARALVQAGDLKGAEQALLEAEKLASDQDEPHILLGNVLRMRGRYGEAERQFRTVLDRRPGEPSAVVAMAELELETGRADRGLERLVPLLAQPNPPAAAASTAARLLLAGDRDAEAVSRIDEWLTSLDLRPTEKADLYSAKGCALDRIGDYDGAWRAWTEANQQNNSRSDGRHFIFAVEQLVQAYGEGVFRTHGSEDRARDRGAALIVGAPRSGKSMLEQMLACHPEVRGAGELRYLGEMTNRIARSVGNRDRPYPHCIGALEDEALNELAADYGERIESLASGCRWILDTQPTNFLHIGLAAMLQPGIPVIVCRRDPADTAWACFARRFADPGLDFVSSPSGFASFLKGMNRLLTHWQAVSPARFMELEYEELVRNPRRSLERVLGHLCLDWDEGVMEYETQGRPKLARAPVLTRPLDDWEIGRGTPYRDRFTELGASEADGIHDG